MPEMEVSFEVFCTCGAGLCSQTDVKQDRYGPVLHIDPCDKCLDQALEEGRQLGYAEGLADGESNVS